MSEFIFMLTQNDVTRKDAIELYKQIRHITELNFVGFKNIGLKIEQYRELMGLLREDGKIVFLEVVSDTELASVESARMAVELGVDYLIGTFREYIPATLNILKGTSIRFMPYAGDVFDHPCFLRGTLDEIAAAAKDIERQGIFGVNLLAYRHISIAGDVVAAAVTKAVCMPVIVAGGVKSGEQIKRLGEIGIWAFTIGGAVFDRSFIPGGTYAENVEQILWLTH